MSEKAELEQLKREKRTVELLMNLKSLLCEMSVEEGLSLLDSFVHVYTEYKPKKTEGI